MRRIQSLFVATILLLAFISLNASALSAGPNYPSSCVDDSSIGSIAWANPGYATSSDDSYADAYTVSTGYSHYLKATNFGFSIPSGATINGILVEIEKKTSTKLYFPQDYVVKLVKAGSVVGDNKAQSGNWPTSDTWYSYGGSSDLWGTTWSASDINSANFGVVLSAQVPEGAHALVDAFRITVYYTAPNAPPDQSNENPANGTDYVNPSTLSQLSVYISDQDGDTMNWTIQTSPNIGSSSGNNQGNGTKTCSVSNVQGGTLYTWYVNVTDGTDWTNESYWFTTLPHEPSNFVAQTYNYTIINLSWSKPSDSDSTYIRYSTSGYPQTITSGTFLCNTTGTSYQATGLQKGTKYYFSAWTYNSTYNCYSYYKATTSNTTQALELTLVDSYDSGYTSESGPGLYDFDNDGKVEIVWNEKNRVSVWNLVNNNLVQKAYYTTGTMTKHGSITIADVDNDGYKEILAPGDKLYILNYTGSSLTLKYSYDSGYEMHSTPSVCNVDGTGNPEIFFTMNSGNLYVARVSSGTLSIVDTYSLFSSTLLVSPASVTVKDLNNDGTIDFTVCERDGHLDVFKLVSNTITLEATTSTNFDGEWSTPAVADVDGDGNIEIIFPSNSHYVYVYRFTGSSLTLVDSYDTGGGLEEHPAIADIDNDGQLEFVVGGNKLYIFNLSSNTIHLEASYQESGTNWGFFSSPAIADVDGDGQEEIVIGNDNSNMTIYSWDGTTLDREANYSTTDQIDCNNPVLNDVDGDGYYEIISPNRDGILYVWRYGSQTTTKPWPQFGYDVNLTGYKDVNLPPTISAPNPSNNSIVSSSISQLSIYIDDPNNDLLDWSIECSSGDSSSGSNSDSGTKTCSLSNIASGKVYTWWVNVSDGEASANATFYFATEFSYSIDTSSTQPITFSAQNANSKNVSAGSQTSSIPAVRITNNGQDSIVVKIKLNTSIGHNIFLKYNTSYNIPPYSIGYTHDDWWQFRHNESQQGWTSSDTVPIPNTLIYTLENTTGTYDNYAGPLIVNNYIITVGKWDSTHSGINYTKAFYLNNGSLAWQVETGPADDTPLYYNGNIYVITDDKTSLGWGTSAQIHCINLTTGQYVTSFDGDGKKTLSGSKSSYYEGSPIVDKEHNRIYVPAVGYLWCLNATTGATIWSYSTGASQHSPCLFNSYDGNTYVYIANDEAVTSDRKLVCLYANNGTEKWKLSGYDYLRAHDASPLVAKIDGKEVLLFASSAYYMVRAYNATTGSLIWTWQDTSEDQVLGMSYHDGKVFVTGLNNDGNDYVYCLNATTSTISDRVIWSKAHTQYSCTTPAIADGYVYYGNLENKLYCVYESNGTTKWSYTFPADCVSQPAISDGILAIGVDDNNTYVFGNIDEYTEKNTGYSCTKRVNDEYITLTTSLSSGSSISIYLWADFVDSDLNGNITRYLNISFLYTGYSQFNNYSDISLKFEIQPNNPPQLTNPSVTPSSGVADYTVFYFNITWADADGDTPADGYLKVNISKTGWYVNVSMTYISGSNTTGAVYSYSTTLSAGTYTYTFYAYDGTDKNSSGPHSGPSVEAQDLSFTVYTSSGGAYINFTASVTPGQGLTTCYNISATGQDSTTPALKVVNTGNVPLNFTWKLEANLPTGLQLKYNYTNNPPPHNQNTITTTEYQFATLVPVGGDNKTWMWMDFENQYGGTGQETLNVTSSFD